MFDDKEVSVLEPHCQIIVLLSHSAQSKVDKDRLPMWTIEGNKGPTLLLMEGGVVYTWTEKLCIDYWHKLKTKAAF